MRHAIDARVDVVQLRERDLEARALFELTRKLVALTHGTSTRVVVNDRLDVALAAGAGGVHLRASSLRTRAARQLAPRGFLVGRSVHSVDEAVDAAPDADYLIAGAVWPTASKPPDHQLLGLAGFRSVANAVETPVLAIGGVSAEKAGEVARAGAAGLAAITLFMSGREETPTGCRATPLQDRAYAIRSAFGIR